MKIGLIAGGGSLPQSVISGARQSGHAVFTAVLDGHADPEKFTDNCAIVGIAEFGKITKLFRKAECTHVCFAGIVKRPDFRKLRPDMKALTRLPGAIKAAKGGDDALLSYILEVFENDGFEIVSPQDLCADLLLPAGHLGNVRMTPAHKDDAEKSCKIASAIGSLDIGQGAVVCRGLVLAVEAQEGTDAMLRRVKALPGEIRGREQSREGVLAKMLKPGQESRVDLPTIGPETIRLAAEAGLAGIVAESGCAFIIDRDQVVEAADAAGMFIVGLPPSV